MKDLYKRLKISADAPEDAIRGALDAADPTVRMAAEQVLLSPRRRVVYDRNRQLLVNIGELRSRLGLNYTRFWARKEFKDYWPAFTPIAEANAEPPKRRVDPMMIARAFRSAQHHSRRHAARWGGWTIAAFAGAIAVLGFLWWWY
jgi:hypothetical protein